jgi:hypothetical protein
MIHDVPDPGANIGPCVSDKSVLGDSTASEMQGQIWTDLSGLVTTTTGRNAAFGSCRDTVWIAPDVPRKSIPLSPAASDATTSALTLTLYCVVLDVLGICASP